MCLLQKLETHPDLAYLIYNYSRHILLWIHHKWSYHRNTSRAWKHSETHQSSANSMHWLCNHYESAVMSCYERENSETLMNSLKPLWIHSERTCERGLSSWTSFWLRTRDLSLNSWLKKQYSPPVGNGSLVKKILWWMFPPFETGNAKQFFNSVVIRGHFSASARQKNILPLPDSGREAVLA